MLTVTVTWPSRNITLPQEVRGKTFLCFLCLCVCGIIYSLIITQASYYPWRLININTSGDQGTAGSAWTINFQRGIVILNCRFMPVFSCSFLLDRYYVNKHTTGCEKMGFYFSLKTRYSPFNNTHCAGCHNLFFFLGAKFFEPTFPVTIVRQNSFLTQLDSLNGKCEPCVLCT